jgi:hypothetical protein
MKYLLFLLLLTSCTQANLKSETSTYVIHDGADPLEVVIIDGCQYLYGPWGSGTVLCHKGNCNNPVHPEYLRR